MTFNAGTAILDALKIPSEPQLPDALVGATPLELAEARNRIAQIVKAGRDIGKLIDYELAGALQGSALNYGGQIIRSANGGGTAKVKDDDHWWDTVVKGLQLSPRPVDLLSALYPASAVRLTALPKLAAALGEEPFDLKRTHIEYGPPTSPLSVMPKDKAPKYLQDLEEGEIR